VKDIVLDKKMAGKWRASIFPAISRMVSLPERGCLFIIGDDLGSSYMQALFHYDLVILKKREKIG